MCILTQLDIQNTGTIYTVHCKCTPYPLFTDGKITKNLAYIVLTQLDILYRALPLYKLYIVHGLRSWMATVQRHLPTSLPHLAVEMNPLSSPWLCSSCSSVRASPVDCSPITTHLPSWSPLLASWIAAGTFAAMHKYLKNL